VAIARILRIAAALIVAASPAIAAKRAASPEELRELRAKIERLQQDLAATEQSRGGALGELRSAEKAVSDAHRALFTVLQERRTIEGELEAIAARERETRASLAGQQALAERLLRVQYLQGATDRLRLLLEGRDAGDAARRLAYYGYIQKARADVIVELREKAAKLDALERDARVERVARAATVQRLSSDITRSQREIGRLKADEARLARLVDEIARAIVPKVEPKAAGKAPAIAKVDRVADASLAAKPFASLKGRLRLPVRGELANRFGAAREESGAPWKGLFIRSITGETVHAIADGRVVYADWLRGFGNLLILDHGEGYMSLYANNEGLLRQVGETVRSGDPVAQVGASGGHEESGLYFELRRDGKPFDPLKWVIL
jgi:murein hydrolase activator